MKKSNLKRLFVAGIACLTIFSQATVSMAAFKLGDVTSVAGTGEIGHADGNAVEAKFHFPSVAIEGADGTIYVSDTLNHLIRVITPDKKVTTFAGKVTNRDDYGFFVGGFKDGQKLDASFNEPKGLALSATGTLYVADFGNNAIRAIDKEGKVTTITDKLSGPSDLVIDVNGQLLVSDTLNHRIVKVSPEGEVTVVAGGGYSKDGDWLVGGFQDGTGQSAKFNEPTGLALDATGNLYVADVGNQRIRKIDSAGNVTTVAGTGVETIADSNYITGGFANGSAANAKFNFPSGLAIDSEGNLFVADTLNHVIRVIKPNGEADTVAGMVGESGNRIGIESRAQFDGPLDLTVLKNGKLLVVDQMNNKVREIAWFQLPSGLDAASIQVAFKNGYINFSDAQPKIMNGRTLIPLRTISETFGYKVDWNGDTQEIKISNEEKTLELTIGNVNVNNGEEQITLDVAPEIEAGTNRTYVPLRFVAEAFDYQVDWLGEERVIVIR